MTPPPPSSPLFPYTTLFRSETPAAKPAPDNVPAPPAAAEQPRAGPRSEEHTSELQSLTNLVCRLLLEKKKKKKSTRARTRTLDETRDSDLRRTKECITGHVL